MKVRKSFTRACIDNCVFRGGQQRSEFKILCVWVCECECVRERECVCVWVWVWVCVYVSVSACERECECEWVCVSMWVWVCECECVCECLSACVRVRPHACMIVCVSVWVCVCVCVWVCVLERVCVYECVWECVRARVILYVTVRPSTLNTHIASNVRIIYEHWIGNFEINSSKRQQGIFPALSCKGKEKHFSFRIRRINRDTNQTTSEYRSQSLPLHQSARCRILVYIANNVTCPI